MRLLQIRVGPTELGGLTAGTIRSLRQGLGPRLERREAAHLVRLLMLGVCLVIDVVLAGPQVGVALRL